MAIARRLVIASVLLTPLALCGCSEKLTDTGFTGRWSRDNRSAIVRIGVDGEGLAFCVEKLPRGGAQKTTCDGPDRSVVYVGPEPSYAYEYRVLPGANDREILMEAEGAPVGDRPGTPIRWTDRMTLDPGGLLIVSYTVERNGKRLDPQPGPYHYDKVSNKP